MLTSPISAVRTRFVLFALLAASLGLYATVSATAQSFANLQSVAALHPIVQSNRIVAGADLSPQMQLTGHIPAWVTPAHQTAIAVNLGTSIRISIVLRRDPAAEAALDQLLADQQNPASPFYHRWITPEQLGALYGPTQSDLDTVVSWASSQGLTVAAIEPGRVVIQLDGTLAALSNAFHTNFAYFTLGTETRLSATTEPSIPAAFGSVVQSIHGLTEIHFHPMSRIVPYTRPNGQATPETTFSSTAHYILPNDFSVLYDIAGVYSGGNTGATIGTTSQHVAIIGESRIVAADISNFESISGLASYQPNTIIAATDPGTSNSGAAGEATLDVSRVIGTAPGAQVDLVISGNSGNSDGIDIAISYNINTLRDPIMTISFGSCEAEDGQSAATYYNTEFQTAAGEGISTFISSGDSGAAGCDANFSQAPTTQVLSINALCSSTYVTCVGGTEFNDTANPSLYWASTDLQPGNYSALTYIPEGAWNEPNNYQSGSGYWLAATGGGASIYVSRPSWQSSTSFPAGSYRLTPDVSFSASDHNAYIGCFASGGGTCVTANNSTPVVLFSGTSAAAPSMAAIAALINTRLGSKQGNINPLLYSVAVSNPAAIHDATVATSGVTSCTVATPSVCNNSTPAPNTLTGGLAGYTLLTGYDEATGLGSLDVAKFLAAAATSTVSTTLAVTAVPNPVIVNQAVTLTATVAPGASTFSPSGTVQFYANAGAIGSPVTIHGNVATLSYTFTNTNAESIYAIYSGDTNFASSTSPAISLVVNAAGFTLTPASLTYNLISGTTTGNTDAITISSMNGFSGSVALTCAITTASGTAAGTCSVAPTSATLASNGAASGTLTVTTTPGTSGILAVKIIGTSGATTVTSATVTVNLTAPAFTLTPSPAALPASGALISGGTVTSTILITSTNGFTGTATLTCAAANLSGTGTASGNCSLSPASVTLASGGTATATLSIATTAGTSGVLTATVAGTGTTANSSIPTTASTTVTATVVAPGFTLTPAASSLSFTSGATTGNIDTITLTSTNSFAGSVAVNCSISVAAAAYPPNCMATQPATLTPNGTATSTISITSTTAHVLSAGQYAQLERRFTLDSGAFLATLFFVPAVRRRRTLRSLATLALLVGGFATLSGCSSNSVSNSVPTSSAGTYTVTVTGSGTSTGSSTAVTATATFTVIIN